MKRQNQANPIEQAVQALKSGKLIVIPTETVYGLCADPWNESAVQKIFQLKKRSQQKPLALLIEGSWQVPALAREILQDAETLMKKHWPGPLTLIFNKSKWVPPALTVGKDTIGLRMPAHPLALAILSAFGRPIAATSANLSGEKESFTLEAAKHALAEITDEIELWIEGGKTQYNAPSTVLDCTQHPPALLRAGPLSPSTYKLE